MRAHKVERTETSIVANFVADAMESDVEWVEALLGRGIRTHRSKDLVSLCYGKDDPDFADPLVRACRGIVLEVLPSSVTVVCWPFDKFGNSFEPYAAEIDWKTARAEEKLDGSLVKLYRYHGTWVWATNRMPVASEAECNGYMTYMDAIAEADNYADVMSAPLDEENTYMFELTGPRNHVVVRYDTPHLTHIGTRSNVTGRELSADIGIDRPRRVPVSDLNRVVDMAEHLNPSENSEITDEGFVVVDDDWHRIKVKSQRYATVHYLMATVGISRRRAAAILVDQDEEALHVARGDPNLREDFAVYEREYDAVVEGLRTEAEAAVAAMRELDDRAPERDRNRLFAQEARRSARDMGIWFHVRKYGYDGPKELARQIYEKSNRSFVDRMCRAGGHDVTDA